MLKNRAVAWFLISMVPLWIGPAAAEQPELEPAPALSQEEPSGVVIEEIPKDSALEKAGLQIGDVITAWRRLPNPPANPEGAEGVIASYFDWQDLEVEQAPRGTVMLLGKRDGEPLDLAINSELWETKVRPVLPPPLQEIYATGKARLVADEPEAAVHAWRSLTAGGSGAFIAWVTIRIGDVWAEKAMWAEAVKSYREALDASENTGAQVVAWEALGQAHRRINEYQMSEEAYFLALDLRQKASAKSIGAARDLNSLGELAGERGDLDLAHNHFSRALEIVEQFAPQSLLMARTLNNLGVEAKLRGRLDCSQELFLRALEIRKQLAPRGLDMAQSLNNLAMIAETRSDLDTAHSYLLQALQIRKTMAPGSLEEATNLNNLGFLLYARGQLDAALEYHHQALTIREKLAPQSLALATTLNNLGLIAKTRGELNRAHDYFNRSLEIRQQLAPKSLAMANTLDNLGELAWKQGESASAERYLTQALIIRKQVAPGSLDEALSFNNLGAVAAEKGDVTQAQDYFLQALRIQKLRAPHSLALARSLANAGAISQSKGDLDRAYDYYQQALQIQNKSVPESLILARTLNAIGTIMLIRGEWDRAHDYHHRALRIQETLAPDGPDMASTLNKLGILAQDRGELDLAHDYYHRGLYIRRKLSPQGLDVASSLNNLGSLAQIQGKYEQARAYHLQALAIKEHLTPEGLSVSVSLNNLGTLARSRMELDHAHDYYRKALKLTEALARGSVDHVISLHGLGAIAQTHGDFSSAHDYFTQSILALEHQVSILGGSYSDQAGFRAQRKGYFYDMIRLLLKQGLDAEAFHVTERFRAQTLLNMLTERDIAFTADIPKELDRDRRRLGNLYDRATNKLAILSPRRHKQEIDDIRRELRILESEAGELEARIRKAEPRLGALRYPQPLDVERVRQTLDPGTLLLSFTVDKEKDHTVVFALSQMSNVVKVLPVHEADLRSRVTQFLSLITESRTGSSLAQQRLTQLEAAGRELYTLLLGPVAERIAASERLLILPDGPLHALPFAALMRDTPDGSQYLGTWKPLHVALSATVFAELKQRRRPAGKGQSPQDPPQIAVFGDPIYPQGLAAPKNPLREVFPTEDTIGTGIGDPTVRGAAERGLFNFQPLPHTRREVLAIANLFPAGTARIFLGPEALEERIKNLDPKTRILHIAAHGSVDEHLPSGSFLALTIPEETSSEDAGPHRDNGLLQVWEIFERVRLDADLVVLSACDTGLGKELGGEGLIGLTRAFQYAGARTVMASLWSVQDQATSELMIRFYKHLRAGLPKDQALQAAQRELIAGPIEITNDKGEREIKDFSSPYYWAGFQLYGDWQ